MIWTIAAGILVASIPIAIIREGTRSLNYAARGHDDAGPAWVTIAVGFAIAAAIIWYGFAHGTG